MELNNIQKQIYNTYKERGIVMAECPRQSGKTSIMLKIIEEVIAEGKSIGIFTLNKTHYDVLYKKLKQATNNVKNDIQWRNERADVLCYDEVFKDPNEIGQHQKLICLRTPNYPVLRFTYKDLNDPFFNNENMNKIKSQIPNEQWAIEYNGGIIE